MKIYRLIEILTILLRQESVTAPDLARRLEVSRRTIGRDVDELCRAGIPIVTRQGAGGGISIAPGYKLDKSLLTREELRSILDGLQGLDSVEAAGRTETLRAKLTPQDGDLFALSGGLVIDLGTYYKESLSLKIRLLKKAMQEKNIVAFDYYYDKGRHFRQMEPCFILYKWSAWYVFGYCVDRADFRLFKLNRLWDLRETGETYLPRQIPEEKRDFDAHLPDREKITILFNPAAEYRVVEEYGPESCRRQQDGRLLFEWSYTGREHILQWILSFGSKAEVLFPEELRQAVADEAKKMLKKYSSS